MALSVGQMDATLGATTVFMDGKVYAMEKDDHVKQSIKDLMKSSKAIYEGDLRHDGLYRVVVDPSEEKAEVAESEDVNIEKANLHTFPRIRSRAVAEGVHYLHLRLGS